MHITSPSARNHNEPLPFQRSAAVLDLCVGRVRNHGEGQHPRANPLWPLLLCHVHGRIDCGGLGDGGVEPLAPTSQVSGHPVFFAIVEEETLSPTALSTKRNSHAGATHAYQNVV